VITHTRFFESPGLPYTAGVYMVIALGGPMSVNDELELPWLVADRVDGPIIARRSAAASHSDCGGHGGGGFQSWGRAPR